jgi:hypothetical protein
MSNTFMRRAGIAGLGLVAVVLLMVLTTRVAANSSGVLDACINPGNGMMRLVDSSSACHQNETFVEWNITGPQGPAGPQGTTGPQGPQGPQGPPGTSAGGPPFVWVCTPANIDSGGNVLGAEIDVFNATTANTANVTAHFLAKDGTNLAGSVVPGSNPPDTYPGQTGNNTVTVAPQNTLIIPYQIGQGVRANDNTLLVTVTVVSDQPVAVSSDVQFDGPHPVPCTLLPH